MQCVSVTMAGLPYTSPIIRLALFLPTPGSFSRSVILSGTRPPKSSRSILMQALISRALLFPRPHGRTISSMSETSASARASMEGYFLNKSTTTTFTRASVHWAASLTDTRSFQASSYSRVQSVRGYAVFSLFITSMANFSFVIWASLYLFCNYSVTLFYSIQKCAEIVKWIYVERIT